MAQLLRVLLAVTAIYVVCWAAIYALLMEGDFRYFFPYLRLAWSSPGERPALIQIGAILATLLVCAAGIAVARARRKAR